MQTEYLDYGEVVKDSIMNLLYQGQLDHWNEQLTALSKRNVACYKDANESRTYSILYEGKKYSPQEMDWAEVNMSMTHSLLLHPDFPDLEEDMSTIAAEVDELRKERYEASRFLGSLAVFNVPPNMLHGILGTSLFDIVRTALSKHWLNIERMGWAFNEQKALKTYLKENTSIITAMNERIMVNLITVGNIRRS